MPTTPDKPIDKPIILSASSPLDQAVAAFRAGGTVIYPTETFYALGVDPFNPDAIGRLYALKGRSDKSPVSVIVRDAAMLALITGRIAPLSADLIKRFWPGPLTLIFDASVSVPAALTAKTGSVGARVSSNPVCQRLLDALNAPITATSANPAGKRPPVEVSEVMDYFGGSMDVVIDAGPLPGTKGSTIVDCRMGRIEVVRPGEIPASEIMRRL
ncbi:MAG: threonylcarbamoyl-AMP synthase [Deltaproteobacteria bacterium]|nr:threonylcarbamoyl-AMP synthase [Deltaproteobacteria bacterium]